MKNFVIAHNVVNPETGLTVKQENLQIQHDIPLGTLVEINCDFYDLYDYPDVRR